MSNMKSNKALLLVSNWDSSTGYAWWLMESFWIKLSAHAARQSRRVYLTYPSISTVSKNILDTNMKTKTLNFKASDRGSVVKQCVFIKRHRIGTIYFSDFPGYHWKYLVYRLAGASCIIVHDHAPGLRDKPGAVKKMLKSFIYHLPWLSADGVIAASDYVHTRNIEVACVPEPRCFTVPNGVPDLGSVATLDLRKVYRIPQGKTIMVTTGRANHFKGIAFALEVIAAVINREKRSDLHYVFCGDGPDLGDFQRIAAELNIANHVTFTGCLQDVPACLQACDFALHPSRGEVGYSLSILEYMRAGLAVIVPDNPSVCAASMAGVNGYIYRDNDKDDAVCQIMKLLTEPRLIKQLGAQARQHVQSNYRLAVTHALLLKTVQSIERRC